MRYRGHMSLLYRNFGRIQDNVEMKIGHTEGKSAEKAQKAASETTSLDIQKRKALKKPKKQRPEQEV